VVFVVLPTKYPRQPLCSDSSLWKASRYGAQVLVSLASAAVAAIAILVSSITTLLSLRTERETRGRRLMFRKGFQSLRNKHCANGHKRKICVTNASIHTFP
jgi:hypothetical protein